MTAASVDVVVPVHGQRELVSACLASVLEAQEHNRTPYRVLVVDDGSDDPALSEHLRGLPPSMVSVLCNEQNQGFVKAANRGMAASSSDVILLNSDTEVYGDFVDRMRAAAYSGPRVATVTPFTNFGSIAAYPVPSQPNELPYGWSGAQLDALARRVNRGAYVRTPTAVGFCSYIRRQCLEEVGLFDEVFGAGYGEEVDLCLRASKAGWKHLLAPNVFVLHHGGATFGEERANRLAGSRQILRERWPRFPLTVRRYTSRDPARPARQRLTAARIAEDERPVILRVIHSGTGGVRHHVTDLSRLCRDAVESLEMLPGPAGRLLVRDAVDPASFTLDIPRSSSEGDIARLLTSLGVTRVHIHHLLGHGAKVNRLIRLLGLPIDVTLHDYFFVSPQTHLVDQQGAFAGEPDLGTEAEVVLLRNTEVPSPGKDLREWRDRWRPLIEGADRVIAQSNDCATRHQRYFALPNVRLVAPPSTPEQWPQPYPRDPGDAPLRVVTIGALSREKGADLLESTARLARSRGLPLEFHLAGFAYRDLDTAVRTYGRYERANLMSILREIDPHVAWFPVRWPETWLQTLNPALELGLPIMAADIGALPERLGGRQWSWLADPGADASSACTELMDVRRSLRSGSFDGPGPPLRRRAVTGFYPEEYIGPVAARPITRLECDVVANLAAEWTRTPPPVALQFVRSHIFRAARRILRSRFGRIARWIPPFHVENFRRLVLTEGAPARSDPTLSSEHETEGP